MAAFDTPFVFLLGAFAVAIVAILASAFGQAHTRRLRAQQHLAMLSRGLSVAEMERLLVLPDEPDSTRAHQSSLDRRFATSRRAAAVLISFGVGLGLFFIALAALLQQREVLSGAAASFIPLCLGLGFAAEYRLQARARDAQTHLPETPASTLA